MWNGCKHPGKGLRPPAARTDTKSDNRTGSNLCTKLLHMEVQSEDRAETLSSLDELMSDKIDLVTIQLGENASDLNTFEADFEELIRYIQNGAPNAQIVVIGDFWEVRHRDSMKEYACEVCGVDFVSLDEIKEKGTYRCGIGTIVFGEDGNPHTVEHEGVANHPGDEAMMWIAKRVFMKVKDK